MKRLTLTIVALTVLMSVSFAQKFAFVDSEYILDRIPSYKAAMQNIDEISKGYEEEIKAMYTEVETLSKNFQTESVLMSDEQKTKKEDEIMAKVNSIKELQQKYFGPDGTVFQKRQELIKPIQDEVYNAVKELALDGGYAAIFDTSAGAGILYENARYNKSDEVLEKLGYK
jgi:outer membrane protein